MASSPNPSHSVSRVRFLDSVRDGSGVLLASNKGYIHLTASTQTAIVVLESDYSSESLELLVDIFAPYTSFSQLRGFPGYKDIGGQLQRVFRGAWKAAKVFNSPSVSAARSLETAEVYATEVVGVRDSCRSGQNGISPTQSVRATRSMTLGAGQGTGVAQEDASLDLADPSDAVDQPSSSAQAVVSPSELSLIVPNSPPALPQPLLETLMLPSIFTLTEPFTVAAGTEVMFFDLDATGNAFYSIIIRKPECSYIESLLRVPAA